MKLKQSQLNNIKRICLHYGASAQKVKAREELFELEIAIFNENLELDSREHVIEEMSDVYVMLEQLKLIYKVTDEELMDIIDFKIRRQLERIKNEWNLVITIRSRKCILCYLH